MSLLELIFFAALIAQSNPNWLAFVFKTDPSPFGERLQEILSRYEDGRLLYVAVADEFLPPFSKADAGYTTTDHVLRTVLRDYPQCRWLSVTNGDNAYGSGVVNSAMASADVNPLDSRPVSMLLAPTDSRNFAEQGENHSVCDTHTTNVRAQTMTSARRSTSGLKGTRRATSPPSAR